MKKVSGIVSYACLTLLFSVLKFDIIKLLCDCSNTVGGDQN